jgi:hypothetical protein
MTAGLLLLGMTTAGLLPAGITDVLGGQIIVYDR